MKNAVIMFQDEARFGRINSPHKCWVRGKERTVVYCQIVREYTYAYAAICPFDGTTVSLVLPYANNAAMSIFLAEVSQRQPDKTIIMFMDKAGWHRANELKIPHNIRILWLPSYSPELNPAEHLWDELREKWFHNITFDSIRAVEDRLVDALLYLENNKLLVRSMTGFDWIASVI